MPAQEIALRMTPAQLDLALDRTLARERYSWRVPERQIPKAAESSVLTELLRQLGRSVVDMLDRIGNWLGAIFKWLVGLLHPGVNVGPKVSAPSDWGGGILVGALLLLTAFSCALGIWFWRSWKSGADDGPTSLREERIRRPDLASAELSGNELPVEEWGRMASEAMARGEYRLALRAWYLASLGELARRQWLALRKSRTGGEYMLELRRKAPQKLELQGLFRSLSLDFERAWYGEWTLGLEDAQRFAGLFERLGGLA